MFSAGFKFEINDSATFFGNARFQAISRTQFSFLILLLGNQKTNT